MIEIAVLFHRLGPYHHARLYALAARRALRVIEFSTVDNTYAWDTVDAKTQYPVASLFTDSDVNDKPVSDLTHKMQRVLDEWQPRVVAIPGWSSPAALVALAWCARTGTPAILLSDSTVHDEPRARWKEWVKSRIVLLYSSALVAGAPHVEYAAMLGMRRAGIFTGYDVVDNTHFQCGADAARAQEKVERTRLGLPENYFLASNRFIEKKNLPRLLEAYARYAAQAGEEAWHLVMLGDGPLKPILSAQAAAMGLTGLVHFPGFKQYEELPIFYGLASAFVHASSSEQWGLVVNEAMASGLPVLVSKRCGCAPDLVKSGMNGFTFDPFDVEDIAGRMLQITQRDCDLAPMGHASREIIRNWTPETFATNLVRAAEVAIATPPPHAGWLDRALLWALMRR